MKYKYIWTFQLKADSETQVIELINVYRNCNAQLNWISCKMWKERNVLG